MKLLVLSVLGLALVATEASAQYYPGYPGYGPGYRGYRAPMPRVLPRPQMTRPAPYILRHHQRPLGQRTYKCLPMSGAVKYCGWF